MREGPQGQQCEMHMGSVKSAILVIICIMEQKLMKLEVLLVIQQPTSLSKKANWTIDNLRL